MTEQTTIKWIGINTAEVCHFAWAMTQEFENGQRVLLVEVEDGTIILHLNDSILKTIDGKIRPFDLTQFKRRIKPNSEATEALSLEGLTQEIKSLKARLDFQIKIADDFKADLDDHRKNCMKSYDVISKLTNLVCSLQDDVIRLKECK